MCLVSYCILPLYCLKLLTSLDSSFDVHERVSTVVILQEDVIKHCMWKQVSSLWVKFTLHPKKISHPCPSQQHWRPWNGSLDHLRQHMGQSWQGHSQEGPTKQEDIYEGSVLFPRIISLMIINHLVHIWLRNPVGIAIFALNALAKIHCVGKKIWMSTCAMIIEYVKCRLTERALAQQYFRDRVGKIDTVGRTL